MDRGYRWRILALLFAATTISYLDRSILGVLAPTLQYRVFHWSNADFAALSMAFKLAYGIGLLGAGSLMDRWGVRWGYLLSVLVWSCFSVSHIIIVPRFGMAPLLFARFGLGLGEGGNFPAAVRAVSTWFPARDRALAMGIFNAGSNIGAILAPLLAAALVRPSGVGWQWVFAVTGVLGALWCAAWLNTYRDPERNSGRARIASEGDGSAGPDTICTAPKVMWHGVFRGPVIWGISILRLTDAAWWFYLFWGGKFLFDRFGLDIQRVAVPLILIYAFADVGSIAGGWLSSFLIRRGCGVVRARKLTMLLCAILVLPVAGITQLDQSGYWLAVLILGLAAAAHQGWSANVFSLIVDCTAPQTVASVTGFTGMIGVFAALTLDWLLGQGLDTGSGYTAAFICAGSLYVTALLIFHLLVRPSPTDRLEVTLRGRG